MIDTKRIKSNLGSRDSIALIRDDVLELIDVYELHCARNVELIMRFPADFPAKH